LEAVGEAIKNVELQKISLRDGKWSLSEKIELILHRAICSVYRFDLREIYSRESKNKLPFCENSQA
jgi:hypothetical protein